ncbi:hypothetical protein ABIB40_002668 [Pedobacter sp. UYP30]
MACDEMTASQSAEIIGEAIGKPEMSPTKLEDFAKEFAMAFEKI